MQEHAPTLKANSTSVRYPFGELHYAAIRATPPTSDNFQRDEFLRDRPNVWFTLERHLKAMRDAGCCRERYVAVIESFAAAAIRQYDKAGGEPKETLAEAFALDAAIEGTENVSQYDALANTTPGTVHRVWTNLTAALSVKQRNLRVVEREIARRSMLADR
jgi:hypothetical protein